MSDLRQETLAIHRLRIRAAHGGSVPPEGVRALRREIEWADWPQAPGESWVFIRRLEGRAPRGRLARKLLQEAREQIFGGTDDNVVRFADLTEMLAALLADLARGQAAERWYWRHWARLFPLSRSRAVADLLTEHITHLPAICARLERLRALDEIWRGMDETDARRVMQALAWHGGFPLPEVAEVETALETGSEGSGAEPAFRIPGALLARWAPVVRHFPLPDPRHRLGLSLAGQEAVPLMLQRKPAMLLAGLHRTMTASVTGKDTVRRDKERAANHRSTPDDAPAPPSPVAGETPTDWKAATAETGATSNVQEGREAHGIATAPAPSVTSYQGTPPASGAQGHPLRAASDPSTPDGQAAMAPHPGADRYKPRMSALLKTRPSPPPPGPTWDHDFEPFPTAQGGLLYLLNFLNRPEPQALMGTWFEQLPNGWGWLYRLGQELQLEESDPLVGFIAAQLGFDHPSELERLPPLPAREPLLALARRWYGVRDLWRPELLHLEARVRATPSHVDLYASLKAVKLPVRLAGLDINPGWLPWLGRVVTFHYE